MSQRIDLAFASIADISARVRAGRLSPVALAEHCLDCIEALNPTLNAFITVTPDLAREQARAAEDDLRHGRWRGPLHGIPVAVKDFYDTAGIRTTAASRRFQHRVPSQDADLVVRLRDSGAALVGKTNMHELGMGTTSLESHFGPVINPWSAGHVAGGSSGGSAAAVAAGLCFATVDTDAIGSGRLPAATCGVTCHKPTFGLLSVKGILAGEQADPAILLLSHPCVTARSVEDVALVFAALTGAAEGDAVLNRSTIRRVGIVTNFAGDDDVKQAFETFAAGLEAIGVDTVRMKAPLDKASFDLRTVERDRAAINAELFVDVDAIVLPTLTAPTPTIDDARVRGTMAVSPDNTFFCNYFGLPAITIPNGVDRSGLPLGAQFVGRAGGDLDLLSIAAAYQDATGWRYVPPEVTRR